jgi:tetratricopeptide (TPR) repeat protein
MRNPPILLPVTQAPPDVGGWEATALVASVPEASVYECHPTAQVASTASAANGREAAFAIALRHTFPPPQTGIETNSMRRDPGRPEMPPVAVVVVRGQRMLASVVGALWKDGRRLGCKHFSHELAAAWVSHVMKGRYPVLVGGPTLKLGGVQGSGFFSTVLGARLLGPGGEGGGVGEAEEEGEGVAVKVFLGEGSQAAFEAELKILRTLTAKISPAALVVRFVGVVDASGDQPLPWPALVMTPLCVESLEQRIDRFAQEPYTLQKAVAWAGQVALSLHRLHRESQLRHGDVTLRNVLLGRDERAYLADMGVAEHNHPYGRQQLKCGKRYSASVAPEAVIRGGEEGSGPDTSDARADVWSWGVVLHALLTGSTTMAQKNSGLDYLEMMQMEQWRDEMMAPWRPEELSTGVLEALKHSLCKSGERVGLLAAAVLLGDKASVKEMVSCSDAPEEVKKAELDIAMLEARMVAPGGPGGLSPPEERSSQVTMFAKLANYHEALGDESQAIARLQQAVRLFTDQADDLELAKLCNLLALALDKRGDHKEAEKLHKRALTMRRRLLPEDQLEIANSLTNLALCHYSQSEYGEARLLHEEALAIRRRMLSGDHPDIARSLNNLGGCHYEEGEYGKAALLHEEALAIKRRSLGEDHLDIVSSLNNLAVCRFGLREYGKAALLHEEALAVQRRLLGEQVDDRRIGISLSNLAECHEKQGDYGKAMLIHQEALTMKRRSLPKDHPSIAVSLINIAECLERQGEYRKALRLNEKALRLCRRVLHNKDHQYIAASLFGLANCHFNQGEYGKAMLLHEEALAVRRRVMPNDHPDIIASIDAIALAAKKQQEAAFLPGYITWTTVLGGALVVTIILSYLLTVAKS